MRKIGMAALAAVAALTMACNNPDTRNDTAGVDNRDHTPGALGTSGESDSTAVPADQREFLDNQLAANRAEIELGQLAADRGANPAVKQFAQMLVQDHTKAETQLKQTAAQYNVQPDAAVSNDDQDLMNRLREKRGAEFDRDYIQAMVDAHQDAVDALEKRVNTRDGGQPVPEQADTAVGTALNKWAATTLPAVQHHLDEAKQLDDQLSRANRNSTR